MPGIIDIPSLGENPEFGAQISIKPLQVSPSPDYTPVNTEADLQEQVRRAHQEAVQRAINDVKAQVGKAHADAQNRAAGGSGDTPTAQSTPQGNLPQEVMNGVMNTIVNNPIIAAIPGLKDKLTEYYGKQGINVNANTMSGGEEFGKKLPGYVAEGAALVPAGAIAGRALEGAPGGLNVISQIGKALASSPGRTITGNVIAGVGAEEGAKVGEPVGRTIGGDTGAEIGSFVGGVLVPATMGWAISKAEGAIRAPFDMAAKWFKPGATSPLRNPEAIPHTAQTYTEAQIAGDLAKTQTAIDAAIEKVPREGSSKGLSIDLAESLQKAKRYSDSVEDTLWARVPKGTQVSQDYVVGMDDALKSLEKESNRAALPIPSDEINFIKTQIGRTRPVIDPETGRVIRNGRPMTLDALINLHSQMRNIIRIGKSAASMGSVRYTGQYIAQLEKVDNILLQTIDQVNPDDIALTQAREYTRKQADLFSRGLVGKVLGTTGTGGATVDPAEVMDYLSRAGGKGVISAKEIQDFVNGPVQPQGSPQQSMAQLAQVYGLQRIPPEARAALLAEWQAQDAKPIFQQARKAIEADTGNPATYTPTVTEQDRAAAWNTAKGSMPAQPGSEEITSALENTIYAQFREAGDLGGEKAMAFLRDPANRERIMYLSNVGKTFKDTEDALGTLLEQKKAIEKSALGKWVQSDTEVAFQRIFSSDNPGAMARSIFNMVSKDPDAVNGLKAGMYDEFIRLASSDPTRAVKMLDKGTKMRSAFEAVLSPQEMARFDRIVSDAFDVKNAGTTLFPVRGAFILGARILGAKAGRMLSTGTIQAPAVVSQAFRQSAEKWMRLTPAGDLMRFAIADPKWEKVLNFRAPHDTTEATNQARYIRRLLFTYQGAKQGAITTYQDRVGGQ